MTANELYSAISKLEEDMKQTPNPLDESELRKKAQLTHESHYKSLVPLSNIGYECMLDFAKYYHSIQPKEEPKEGVYFVTGQNPMAHKTYEGALKEAMVIGNSKIFKLVATCERTINVKEV